MADVIMLRHHHHDAVDGWHADHNIYAFDDEGQDDDDERDDDDETDECLRACVQHIMIHDDDDDASNKTYYTEFICYTCADDSSHRRYPTNRSSPGNSRYRSQTIQYQLCLLIHRRHRGPPAAADVLNLCTATHPSLNKRFPFRVYLYLTILARTVAATTRNHASCILAIIISQGTS